MEKNEILHVLLGVDGWQEIYSDAPSQEDIEAEMLADADELEEPSILG